MSRSRIGTFLLLCFASFPLIAGLILTDSALAQAVYDPPFPTREQRERIRKGPAGMELPNPSPRTSQQEAAASSQDDVNITHYLLDLTFDPSARTVSGSVTVSGTSLVSGFQHLVLGLYDNMAVWSVPRG